ncbi:MAG TPA: four helix bundle protein [Anaerolineaceae bacterium]|nr:four helix bundle protein [Anaerolineaceae bacterium]
MTSIKRFEDLQAWQEARLLTQQVYALMKENGLSKDYGLRDQICRAAVSTMANIAEGFDCETNAEYIRFLGFSRRSAAEVQSLLYVTLDAGYLTPEVFQSIYEQANKTKALVGGLMHYLATHPRPS